MQNRWIWLVAVLAGGLLACMTFFNGMLARYTSPLESSLAAHLIGFVTAGVLFAIPAGKPAKTGKTPFWTYLGGVPGAIAVVVSNVTVNSRIGLSGSLALMLLGQTVFGLTVDSFGLFEMRKRVLGVQDYLEVLMIMSGSAILIFYAR